MVTAFLAWLLADFISGLVHWAEDRLLPSSWSRYPLIGQILRDNERHHYRPLAMLKETYLGTVSTTAPIAIPIGIGLYLLDAPTVIWLSVSCTAVANLVHRWAHTPDAFLPLPIRFLQWTGILISNTHHARHHVRNGMWVMREDTTGRYCTMTAYLNPILDYIQFFKFLELMLGKRGNDEK